MTLWHNLGKIGLICSVALACSSHDADPHNGGAANSSTTGTTAGQPGVGGSAVNTATATGGSPGTTSQTGTGGVWVTSGGSSPLANTGGTTTTVSGSTINTGGTGGNVCTTQPPKWSDCDAVGDFQPAPIDADGGANVPPDSLTAISDLSLLVAEVRERDKAELQTEYKDYWTSLRSYNCSSHVVCPITSIGGAAAYSTGVSASTGGSGSTTETRSRTNNQVAGVDEPDLLKLDARYVYIVTPNELLILDAQNPATTTESARLKLDGTPKSLLISGDRALVIASKGDVPQKASCTYAYDCQFAGDGYPTLLLVIDISDRTRPYMIRKVQLSGSYLAGRMIGSVAHIVTEDELNTPHTNVTSPYVNESSAAAALAAMNKQYDTALSLVDSGLISLTSPTATDQQFSNDAGGAAIAVLPGQLHASNGIPTAVLTVTSFDFTATNALHQEMIFSDPGALYASENRLYMAVPELKSNYAGYGADATWIHGFVLSGTSATYQGSGRVTGHVINQFSLDEYQGDLRIATSTGWVPDPAVHSTVSVLGWQDSHLVPKGAVDNIAPTEDIRAVRFAGPRGYVVTFKKTDPLFVLNLANPAAPTLEGELQIPGFSTYIHPLDDSHLLTMGYNADDQGSFAWFNGVQLQIMDVANASNPRLMFKETIGTRGSSSEALTDHLAFNYFAAKQMLAIPMTICEGGGNGKFGDVLTFTGLLVYDVTLETGFKLHGRVPHPAPAGYYGSYTLPACSNWWTNASSPVKRSAFIEEYILSLGDALVKVDPLANLGQSVAEFPVGDVPCEILTETGCQQNTHCKVIRGTSLGSSTETYLGCASIPTGASSLTCQAGDNCIMQFSSNACATVASSCVPDGWGVVAAGACTAAACGK